MHSITDVSIIIISFNTCKLIVNCINSIYNSNLKFKFELIVVDNDSKDCTCEILKNKFNKIKIIKNNKNNLFAKANNQGSLIANGRFILLLNSDTIVQKDNLEKLVSFLDSSPQQIACVGPTVLNENGTIQSHGYALPSVAERVAMCFKLHEFLPKFIARFALPDGTPGLIEGPHKVGWISGCCMLIRREVYLEIGGLNEDLEFYGEEPELGYRLNKAGYETYVVTNANIIHLGGRSTLNNAANFLKDLDGKLYRYSQLQKFTVGFAKAISMSQVVLCAAFIKRFLALTPKNKSYFDNAIAYEKKVIDYLKLCQQKTDV